MPPSLPRRIVYVFAHVILPYLLERVLVRMPHREMLSSLTKFLTSAHMMFFYYTGACEYVLLALAVRDDVSAICVWSAAT